MAAKKKKASDNKSTLHAFDFLSNPVDGDFGVIVLFGGDSFLKSSCRELLWSRLLPAGESEMNQVQFDGEKTDFREVFDELSTVSLFGSGEPRLVYVRNADKLVSDCKEQFEDYALHPLNSGILVLETKQWRSNTRAYKAVASSGLQIDCRIPMTQNGKSVDTRSVSRWLSKWALAHHKLKISAVVAEYLVGIIGPELGIIDQSFSKLKLYLDEKTAVTEKHIDDYIGGWQQQTIWDLFELAISGNTSAAITQLDRLLHADEKPIALFGQFAWSLRRYAAAFEESSRMSRSGRSVIVKDVLSAAGFFPGQHKDAEAKLRKIGRKKGLKFYRFLMECDLALKSTHSQPPRSRQAFENLILQLSGFESNI